MTPDEMRELRNELVDVLIEHWDRVMASTTDPNKPDSLIVTLDDEDDDGHEMYLRIQIEEVTE